MARIASRATGFSFAMPEVGIGFFPDVGATWFLPRMPGELGTWCALTGDRLKTADAVAAGVATHHVRSDRFADLTDALCGNVSVDATLAAFAEPAGEGAMAARRAAIDRLFAGDRVEDILQRLDAEEGDGSRVGRGDRRNDPRQVAAEPEDRARAGAARQGLVVRGLHDLRIPYRVAHRLRARFLRGRPRRDRRQGQCAALEAADLADITDADVERHFASLGADELVLP